MRTPHLRTDLSAAEVATAVREAADLIERLTLEVDNGLARIRDRNAEIKALNEQIINQSRTIERYQKTCEFG